MTSINDLNDDCLLEIFKFVPFEDRVTNLIKVSKRWKELAIRRIDYVDLDETNESLLKSCWPQIRSIKSLEYWLGCYDYDPAVNSSIPNRLLADLVELDADICLLFSSDFQRVLKFCTKLESLRIFSSFKERLFSVDAENCEQLMRTFGPKLRKFKVSLREENGTKFLRHLRLMPNLVELVILPPMFEKLCNPYYTDEYITPNLNLRKLTLEYYGDTIQIVSEAYPNVEYLRLSDTFDPDIEEQHWRSLSKLTKLKTLDIYFTKECMEELTPQILGSIIKPMKELRCLILEVDGEYDYYDLVASIANNSPQLRKLSIWRGIFRWSMVGREISKFDKLDFYGAKWTMH